MPFKKRWEAQGVVTIWYGQVTEEEILWYVSSIRDDSEFDAMAYCLHDFRKCTSLSCRQAGGEYVTRLDSAASAKAGRPVKMAVVTNRGDVTAMVKDCMAANPVPHELQIFPDMARANQWLGRQVA